MTAEETETLERGAGAKPEGTKRVPRFPEPDRPAEEQAPGGAHQAEIASLEELWQEQEL
jgi:hypothetical protein